MEPGLGESETFYSLVITAFNSGAMISAFSSGVLLKFIPYWYLILSSLLLQVLSWTLYVFSTTGWLILLSKLLSGLFLGAEFTLALAYISESSQKYQAALKELGEDTKKATRVKHRLFALRTLGFNIGRITGAGIFTLTIIILLKLKYIHIIF